MSESNLIAACRQDLPALMAFMEEMVNIDSPSGWPQGIGRVADVIAGRFEGIGTVNRIDSGEYGPTLEINCGQGSNRVLLVGHMDTVWPEGEAAARPFTVSDDRATGPGVCDMKAGIALAWLAMKVAGDQGLLTDRQVTLIANPDEEIGSPSSREHIERAARDIRAALILEPAGPGGALKTGRRGVTRFILRALGRSAHGSDPASGINAAIELAHQLVRIAGWDREPDVSINVGVVRSGERVNVVPAEATAEIDVRIETRQAGDRIQERLQTLTPVLAGAELKLEKRDGHPPFPRSVNRDLYARARELGQAIGLDLTEVSVGGASDGNYLAAAGIPVLDGLGAAGGGAHALSEYVELDSLPQRAALVCLLATRL